MKICITRSHIDNSGAVQVGAVLDLPDELACEYLNTGLAEPHKEDKSETATTKKTKETATTK